MISVGTKLFVIDNSGAKEVKCIRILKNKKKAYVGDKIVVSIRRVSSSSKVKEGEVLYAVIVRVRKSLRLKNNSYVKFPDNSVILLDKQGELVGTRIFGVISSYIKHYNYSKIVSLANEMI